MKVPTGMTVHAPGGPYVEGKDIPDELVATLPDSHPLKSGQAQTPRATSRQQTTKD